MTDAIKTGRAGVIFDRDGVLNADHGYVGELGRLEWVNGAPWAGWTPRASPSSISTPSSSVSAFPPWRN